MELQALTLGVCEIAKRAGSYIKEEREKFSLASVERKHAHDYVSYVDKGSERLIVEALRQLLPEAGFITEEGSASYHEEQYCWVIDPLDGTTNFIHHYAPYAVSIALYAPPKPGGAGHAARQGAIVLGVVYEVCADECFYAWQGGGAFLNGKALHVSNNGIEDALLSLQLPYNSEAYKPTILSLIDQFYGRAASVRMCGSAAMSLCYVAAGRLDAYAEQFIGQWDYMAGALIVKEAGGQVTNYEGHDDFTQGNNVVASNGTIHQEIIQAISLPR